MWSSKQDREKAAIDDAARKLVKARQNGPTQTRERFVFFEGYDAAYRAVGSRLDWPFDPTVPEYVAAKEHAFERLQFGEAVRTVTSRATRRT